MCRIVVAGGLLALILALGGCAFGPRALEHSHGRYLESVRRVEEEQLLRNIVHVRYNEAPLVLNISSIAAQYELAAAAEARPFFEAPNPSGMIFRTFTTILPFAQLSGANRPTFTLDPADDGTTMRQFLTPISAELLVFLARTRLALSTLLRLWVERINGVPNAGGLGDGHVDFARFVRIAELLQVAKERELVALHTEQRETELSGPLPAAAVTATAAVEAAKSGLEYRPRGDGKSWVLVRKSPALVLQVNAGAEGSAELTELIGLLNLQPGRRRYDLIVSDIGMPNPAVMPSPPAAAVYLDPRSTAQVYAYLARGVEVPDKHRCAGLVPPDTDAETAATRSLFQVFTCAGCKPPAHAYVAVHYRGYWYYLDDRDQDSKTTLALILQLSRLDFKRQRLTAGPTLTLPLGR